MLTQLLALVVLAGLTAAALLVCFAKWGWLRAWEVHRRAWMPRRCDFCAGYWISTVLLLVVLAGAAHLLGLPWWVLGAAPAAGLPAAAVCRVVAGELM